MASTEVFVFFLHNPTSTVITETPALYLKQSRHVEKTVLLSFRQGNRCHLAKFEGVANRNDAEALKGAKILIPREALPPPDEDEFYVADLIGVAAYDGEIEVGRIVSSRPQGGIEIIRIEGETEELEVPLVEDFVASLDIAEGRILLKDVEALPRSPVHKKRKK
jgi:16S rRNA processing protein RimM